MVLLALTLLCFGLMMPNFNALAMEPMGRIAGTASSFVGAVTTGVAAGLGLYVGQHYDGSVLPLVAGFAVFGAAGAADRARHRARAALRRRHLLTAGGAAGGEGRSLRRGYFRQEEG